MNQTFDNQTLDNEFLINNLTTNLNNNNLNSNLICDLENKIDISEHYLYLILNILTLLAFSLPTSKFYLIYLHFLLTIAYIFTVFLVLGENLW